MALKETNKKTYGVVEEKNVSALMRDGTTLKADIYRPDAQGRFPTIVTRTAYNKARSDNPYYKNRGLNLAARGYVYVAQDIRGTYASEGDFYPCTFRADHHDTEDGYDTIEWAASLPWSTGKVGTVGSSYDGWTQWELAHARPPHLEAMIPQAISASTLDQEMSGVLRLGQSLRWMAVNLAPDQIVRDNIENAPRTWAEAGELFAERDRNKWTWFLPLMEIPDDAMYGLSHHWGKWLADRGTDNFDFLTKLRKIEVPAFITTSWFDQQVNALKLFSGMSNDAASETARNETRIMVGPWRHTGDEWDRTVGQVDFGPEAERDFYETVDQWFSYWLKGGRQWGPAMAAGADLRHGRQSMEGGGRMAAAWHAVHRLLLPQRRQRQYTGGRRRAFPGAAQGEPSRPVRVRPQRPGDDHVPCQRRHSHTDGPAASGRQTGHPGLCHAAPGGARGGHRERHRQTVGGILR